MRKFGIKFYRNHWKNFTVKICEQYYYHSINATDYYDNLTDYYNSTDNTKLENNNELILACRIENYKSKLNYSIYNFNINKFRDEISFIKTKKKKIDNIFLTLIIMKF